MYFRIGLFIGSIRVANSKLYFILFYFIFLFKFPFHFIFDLGLGFSVMSHMTWCHISVTVTSHIIICYNKTWWKLLEG